MSKVTVAATQFACGHEIEKNLLKADAMIKQAAKNGAQIILLPELFSTPYFCKDQQQDHFSLAHPADNHPMLRYMSKLAAELNVVLPISFFERANNAYFNSVMVIDADGEMLGIYRKSHIPDGPGYQEKYYFNPGDTGFKVWDTRFARIGVGICWDQWFPESARILSLQGAEILFYPTAIGSEPHDPTIDSRDHWQRVMQGHAGANLIPLVASNRIGFEQGSSCSMNFYGSSFIAGPHGEKITEATRDEEKVLIATFDLSMIKKQRASWGIFRDRRPELYVPILSYEGNE
ncbi:MAG: N-carbamoylputrescine amidase [Alphaproteobacteria bacterium]|nr:N-carbamoylputrescine amidase [Alphaproteobacteria bacterium]